MALNLRTIEPDLHRRLKLAAFSSGKALERFCLEALEACLDASPKVQSQSSVRGVVEQTVPRVEDRTRTLPNVVTKPRKNTNSVATPKVVVTGYVPPRFRA